MRPLVERHGWPVAVTAAFLLLAATDTRVGRWVRGRPPRDLRQFVRVVLWGTTLRFALTELLVRARAANQRVTDELTAELGRAPTDDEFYERLRREL